MPTVKLRFDSNNNPQYRGDADTQWFDFRRTDNPKELTFNTNGTLTKDIENNQGRYSASLNSHDWDTNFEYKVTLSMSGSSNRSGYFKVKKS